ncbi:MAG: helix-turn-helix transcriptional regulator [Bacteroidales bacterium]|nr:helix-turn-helix transcriptional regulator [Bacteroidales bacterium]
MNIMKKKQATADNIKSLDVIKTRFYGEVGMPERDRLENELEALRIGLKIRAARESQHLTQSQLAEKVNKKRTFISKVETDGENITLRTLFDIVERGLGGKLNISIDFA